MRPTAASSVDLHNPLKPLNIPDAQAELARNRCRSQRIDVWQQAVDTDVFNPGFRSAEMRARMSGGRPDAVILTYVGRLGAGARGRPTRARARARGAPHNQQRGRLRARARGQARACTGLGASTPSSSTWYSLRDFISFTVSPTRTAPSTTRKYTITPCAPRAAVASGALMHMRSPASSSNAIGAAGCGRLPGRM